MARIRSIKPEFWTDEKIVGLSALARLLFIGMWNFVDDEGRADYSPLSLKLKILPADNADISALLGEIRGKSLIAVYSVDGKDYFQVCGFAKHQKIDKRSASKIPAPPNSSEFHRITPLDQGWDQGGEGRGEDAAATAASAVAPIEPKDEIFGEGLSWLIARTKRSESSLRSWLGKCCGEFGDHNTLAALIEMRAQSPPPVDPLSRMRAILEPKKRKVPDGPTNVLARAGAELLAEREADSRTVGETHGPLLASERESGDSQGAVVRLAG